jgi:hypothetical protein
LDPSLLRGRDKGGEGGRGGGVRVGYDVADSHLDEQRRDNIHGRDIVGHGEVHAG